MYYQDTPHQISKFYRIPGGGLHTGPGLQTSQASIGVLCSPAQNGVTLHSSPSTLYSATVTPTPTMPLETNRGCGCFTTYGASAHAADTVIAPLATAYSFALTAFGSNRWSKLVALSDTGSCTKHSAATAGAVAATPAASHHLARAYARPYSSSPNPPARTPTGNPYSEAGRRILSATWAGSAIAAYVKSHPRTSSWNASTATPSTAARWSSRAPGGPTHMNPPDMSRSSCRRLVGDVSGGSTSLTERCSLAAAKSAELR